MFHGCGLTNRYCQLCCFLVIFRTSPRRRFFCKGGECVPDCKNGTHAGYWFGQRHRARPRAGMSPHAVLSLFLSTTFQATVIVALQELALGCGGVYAHASKQITLDRFGGTVARGTGAGPGRRHGG